MISLVLENLESGRDADEIISICYVLLRMYSVVGDFEVESRFSVIC